MTFDYFVMIISPVVEALIKRTGLQYNVLDAGWPPLAAITWAFPLAPLLLVIFLVIIIILLALKMTKTVDIDIWNYFHVIMIAAMVFHATESSFLAVLLSTISFIIMLKLTEWTAPGINKMTGMDGICTPHLGSIVYFPIALALNKIMDHIPGLNKIDADSEALQKKLGFLGEPMLIGLVLGAGLSIGAGYNIKQILEIAVNFSAIIYILPVMCGILGGALIPISEGMKTFIKEKFPTMGETYMGLDIAVLFCVPSIVVTSVILIPISLALAFLLPGINFIPLADLTVLLVPAAFICLATKGNIVRSLILGTFAVIANLYIASYFAPFFTQMAADTGYQLANYSGAFTSFLDGGNFYRAWMVGIASMNPICLLLIPVGIFLLFFTWKSTKKAI
jgi:PTS system galactitol-specific IIC component